jgi:hypothetical protein
MQISIQGMKGKNMDEPLTRWYCDVCGQVIEDANDGYVIWRSDEDGREFDFKIIHRSQCDNFILPSSLPLGSFLGIDGISTLLSFLSLGTIRKNANQESLCKVKDNDEFVDFFRRVQTPYYEEARKRFNNYDLLQDLADDSEVQPYLTDKLHDIINKYDS